MQKITISTPNTQWDHNNFTTVNVGIHTVQRHRLSGTPRTVYSIMYGSNVAGRQLSYPSLSDCQAHQKRYLLERDKQPAARALRIMASAQGTLGERAIVILKVQEMDLANLSETMRCNPNALSPVLSRLVRDMRVQRAGKPGSYIYSAS